MLLKRKEKIDEIIEKIYNKNKIKRYLVLIIGCLLLSIAFNVFFLPRNIVYGGVSGISVVIKKLYGIEPSIFILISSVLLLTLSYFTLGWKKTKGSIAGSIIFPICISLTSNLSNHIDFNINNMILIVIFGALIAGIGAGMNFKTGFSTGGTDIINQIISKYFKVSIGKAMLMSDGLIVLLSGFFITNNIYAWENVMYAIIVLYIISIMADKVILGISQCKAFYIVTEHETSIKKFVMDNLSHGITVIESRGGYTGNNQKLIMCIIPTKDYFLAKEGILAIDPNAFFLVTDAYEVSGGSLRR